MTNKHDHYDKDAWLEEVESWDAENFIPHETSLDDCITMLEDHVRCTRSSGNFYDLQMTIMSYELVYDLMNELDADSDDYIELEGRVDDILPFWFVYWQQSYEEYLNRSQPLAPYSVN